MDLHRMEFNVKYRFGQYYKIIDEESNNIIGGIFAFELDDKNTFKIAQFYLEDEYQHLGYGSYVLNKLLDINPDVKTWYVDTIMQEEYNVEFYKHIGFVVIDEEEEHEGLTFVTMMLKNN
jgi:GNAT superfamily N-acetyltransferase